ncbi:bacillithiol system redox-active protein YtxJ [Flavobacteriaceae bacterium]|jgi:bacillithiol system protein YtxJ|nr:bacillithiol system redox-active protein YtxJ [Flavobacteriaceae bacterium]MDB4113597.1 bacillithiol system redox-active protein YtxJ [Flavobacteriaceae bacterium]MDC0117067.1 bacillithiol system redox-active protein YtxJ [Flavobacteriaceae bacterium]
MSNIKWIELDSYNDINHNNDFIVLFKHSNKCIISRMVLKQFEFQYDYNISNVKYYLIDVIKNREVSNEIAYIYNINHESPQLIVIKNGELVHNSSHSDISFSNIKNSII